MIIVTCIKWKAVHTLMALSWNLYFLVYLTVVYIVIFGLIAIQGKGEKKTKKIVTTFDRWTIIS